MSQVPPAPNFPQPYVGGAMPPRPSNKSAVASLVLGLLGCVPWLTGVLAIVFGIVGIRNTRTGASGKGMAIAGLVLGALSVVGWTLFGGAIAALVVGTAPIRDAGKQFIRDIADAKIDAAVAECTSDLTRVDLDAMAAALKPCGTLQDITMTNIGVSETNGVKTAAMQGTAAFSNRPMTFTLNMVKQADHWKVNGIDYDTTVKK